MPYSGNPGASQDDEVRFLVGDTDTAVPRLSDDEVTYLLATYTTPIRAAYQAALALAAKYGAKANKTVGPTSIQYQGIAQEYRELAASLAARGGAQGSIPVPSAPLAGGIDDPLWSDVDWEARGLS